MEALRQWFPPSEEQALLALSPPTALYNWLNSEHREDESATKEAPNLVTGAWGLSLFSHIRSLIWTDGLIQKGYEQYRDDMFRMPFYGSWATIVNGKYVEEIARAPDTYLSFHETFNNQLQLEHVIGPELSQGQMHLSLLRTLNRNLEPLHREISDEAEYIVSQTLGKGKEEDGWVSLKAFAWVTEVVQGLNQRAFVGFPLCRDDEWTKAGQQEDMTLFFQASLLRLFPKSKRGDANEYITNFVPSTSVARKIIAKAIKERIEIPEGDRPNDLLSWTITRVPGEEPDPKVVCGILGLLTMVAQSTTSMSFAHAILHLVAHPECISVLREEILEATDNGDLTYESLEQMRRLDSFIRETQRVSTIGNISLARIVMKDFTFSNGVCVPAGEMVQAVATGVHKDPAHYPEPLEFKPWRFYDLTQAEAKDTYDPRAAAKYDIVSTSPTYLTWGLGRHACPGKWYAAMIMKHLMAYLILHYDLKLPDSAKGKRPDDWVVAGACIPNTSARILLRRKQVVATE
ncbi:hypothetical protein M408DRAFT_332370 [Serendipita vermifera MAFF 305830]|uniref:Cytochrome P450 n=1 Tax=Serendipita vermifera MAFF 305830 TaxID=933852 RepID=A0A0C2X1F0_SERVB|nr:hypothetical protein M408DRAFT_332370 [Serendipita vermifera MAFF 305830]